MQYEYHMKKTHKYTVLDYLTWIVLLASVAYLMHVLINFKEYQTLFQLTKSKSISDFWWLLLALGLLPLNLLFESIKWKKIVASLENFSIISAFKSVLAGISTGFVTPNRVGDIIGKLNYLQKKNQKKAVSLGAIAGITQNIAIILPSIPFAILFFLREETEINHRSYISLVLIIIALLLFLLFYLPRLAGKIKHPTIQPYISALTHFQFKDLLLITFWSIVRYAVFGLQLYCLLVFFDVDLSVSQAIIGITTNYLLITITPSIAVSEALVRSSWAVFVLSKFSENTAGIMLAGISLWLINVIIPVLIGNAMLAMKKRK